MIIDSHSHLNHESFVNEIDLYLAEAKANNVDGFICVGWDIESSKKAVEIANQYHNVYAAIGIHPSDARTLNSSYLNELKKLLANKKVIAIGEIGLDFYWDKDETVQEKQKQIFIEQINLANEFNLPIIVHSRDANNLTYEILNNNRPMLGGIMHCYAAGKDYVQRYIDLNFYFGIGGVITFNNSKKLKEAAEIIPIERIVLESDAPYLTPVPFRGKPNHSKYIPYTLDALAKIKNIDCKVLENKIIENIHRLFPSTDFLH